MAEPESPAELPREAGAPPARPGDDVADLDTLMMRLRFLDLWQRHDPAARAGIERDRRRIVAAIERRGLRPL